MAARMAVTSQLLHREPLAAGRVGPAALDTPFPLAFPFSKPNSEEH